MQTEAHTSTPQIVVISGPMAGGKSSVIPVVLNSLHGPDRLLWKRERRLDVSDTTRACRVAQGEDRGAYNFDIPKKEMEENISKGLYIQYSPHSGELYGSRVPKHGQPIVMDIEVSGVRQIIESTNPEVAKARVNMKAIFLLQSSMESLFGQITNRPDGMTEAKKLERIARYPSEIRYILQHNLPYAFILNESGRINHTKEHVAQFVLGEDNSISTQSRATAVAKASEAEEWLQKRGLEPAKIVDPILLNL